MKSTCKKTSPASSPHSGMHLTANSAKSFLSCVHSVNSNIAIFNLLSCESTLWLFSHDGKVRILNRDLNRVSRCASWITIRYFDSVYMYAKKHRESWFEMRNSKTHLKRDLRCASQITILDVFGVHTVQNTVFRIVIQDAHF